MKNRYEVKGDVTVIFITRRDGTVLESIIDTVDLQRLLDSDIQKWSAYYNPNNQQFYGHGHRWLGVNKHTKVYLHRFLTDAPRDKEVDHINHNTLDNRQCNLRLVTHSGNVQNRKGAYKSNGSGVRGVHWHKPTKKWIARVSVNGKNKHLGSFEKLEDAEKVAKEARALLMPYSKEATSNEYDISKLKLPKLTITHRLKSGVPGVSWREVSGKWQAHFKRKYVGLFETVEEAKRAIEKAKEALSS